MEKERSGWEREEFDAGTEERDRHSGQGSSRAWTVSRPPEEAGLGAALALGSSVMKWALGSVERWGPVEQSGSHGSLTITA